VRTGRRASINALWDQHAPLDLRRIWQPGKSGTNQTRKADMATALKPGAAVKARSTRSGKVVAGKFVKERPGAKGVYFDVDLGAEHGGVKSFRPSQVTAA
jgi:hypothetical protein